MIQESGTRSSGILGTPVVPFSLLFGCFLLRTEYKEKDTLIVKGSLGNLGFRVIEGVGFHRGSCFDRLARQRA